MSDQPPPNCEEIERYMDEMPKHIIGRLPKNTESRRAQDHAELAYKYALESRERPADR